ncbi:hypothetical protein [Cellulomonas telluris]|uniref:hypothetical protein n=1 Tax=Cellulomonas telluris TaxID=2306636 RepID=UPI0010A8574E|nr:hypothetical protein [Cellulomonas telluris]
MTAFVIAYNRRTGERKVEEYAGPGGYREAFERRLRIEGSADPDVEVVSLVSDSLATIKRTHSRYFQDELSSC